MKTIHNKISMSSSRNIQTAKKLLICLLAAGSLAACNSGSSNSTSGITPYNLQNYKLTSANATNNCTVAGNSQINCDSQGTFGGIYKVTFNTTGSTPGAYVVMPPSGDTYGLNIAAADVDGGCSQTAPATGDTYTCNFTIGANGTAEKGKSVNLYVNGALGQAQIITININ